MNLGAAGIRKVISNSKLFLTIWSGSAYKLAFEIWSLYLKKGLGYWTRYEREHYLSIKYPQIIIHSKLFVQCSKLEQLKIADNVDKRMITVEAVEFDK